MSDISHLLAVINRIVDNGNTVVVIGHNRDIIKNADWIIDMGPEGGHKGGQILFEGIPKDLLNIETSYTAQYLRSEHQPREKESCKILGLIIIFNANNAYVNRG